MSQPSATDPLAPVRASLAAGDLGAAERTCRAVLSANAADARAHGLLAHVLHRAGKVEAALEHATRSLALDPGFVPSLIEQAAAARALGREAIARDALLELVRRRPRDVALFLDLATAHAALGERDAAIAALDAALALDAAQIGAWLARAQLAPTPAEGADVLRRADAAIPDSIPVLEALADAQHAHAASFEDWAATLRRLCALQPGRVPPLLRLAAAYRQADLYAEARAIHAQVLAIEPASAAARWASFQLPDSLVSRDDAQERAFLQRWERGLAEFETLAPRLPAEDARACLASATNVFAHYRYDEDTAPQRRHARVLRVLAETVAPGAPPRAAHRAGRPRIGFLSAYFRVHTVGRLFSDLIARLPGERFERLVFHADATRDARTARLEGDVDQYVGGTRDLAAWATLLREARLDLLVHVDVGMHPTTQALAALRLAPVQVALWGHPVTTGLETIDAFVSSALLEPADGQRHYTEPLHLLPGLGAWYEGPRADAPRTRTPREGLELLMPASVYKLSARHDRLLARIARSLPESTITLRPHPRAHVRAALERRLATVFHDEGVDVSRVRVLPTLSAPEFFASALDCDLALDTIGWSGGMTAIDLLGLGVPTVSLPGVTMRSLQTAALLDYAGAGELVARDEDDYVAKVVALAGDAARRDALSSRLRDACAALYRDDRVVDAFADLLDRFVDTRASA